jgi:drug/metabolite transporter (DMT)-like permease
MPMFSVAKRTLEHVDAFSLASLRYGIGVLLLIILLVASEGCRALRFDRRLVPATVLGFFGITAFNLLLWIGMIYTRPEHAAIILQQQTPLIAIAAWLTRGQRPAAFTLGCMVLALAGVLLVVTKGNPAAAFAEMGTGGALLGDLLVFLAALSWVIYTLGAGIFAGWSPLRFTTLTCIPGVVGLLIANAIAFMVGWATMPTVEAIGSVGWQIAYFAVCTVVLGVLGFNNAARQLGPLNTMLMLNLVPVGVFAIEAALGRSFSAIELIGAGIVIAALVANNLYLRGASRRR